MALQLASVAVLLLAWVQARLLELVAAVLRLLPPVRVVADVDRLLPLQLLLLLAVASNSFRNNPVILPL